MADKVQSRFLATKIEGGQLMTTIQSSYESGQSEELLHVLKGFVVEKDDDVSLLCREHYELFLESISEVLQIREQAAGLKSDVIKLNEGVQDAASVMAENIKALQRYRLVKKNVQCALEALRRLISLLDVCKQINLFVERDKYYAALQLIEELETSSLQWIKEYELGVYLEKRLPVLKNRIRITVTDRFTEWLLRVREIGPAVGAFVMLQVHEQAKKAIQLHVEGDTLMSSVGLSGKSVVVNDLIRRLSELDGWKRMVLSQDIDIVEKSVVDSMEAWGGVSLGPVYECLYIYTKLGAGEEFRHLYAENRRLQVQLVSRGPLIEEEDENMTEAEWLELLKGYLCDITGYYVVETSIATSTGTLVNMVEVETLWDNSMLKLKEFIVQHMSQYVTSQAMYHETKMWILMFLTTMQAYGYSTDRLIDLLASITERYADSLIRSASRLILRSYLDNNNALPMTVNSVDEIEEFKLLKLPVGPLPLELPFTVSVVESLYIVQEFLKKLDSWLSQMKDELFDAPSLFAQHSAATVVHNSLTQLLQTFTRLLVQTLSQGKKGKKSEKAEAVDNHFYMGMRSTQGDSQVLNRLKLSLGVPETSATHSTASMTSVGGVVQMVVNLEHMVKSLSQWNHQDDESKGTLLMNVGDSLNEVRLQAESLLRKMMLSKLGDIVPDPGAIEFAPTGRHVRLFEDMLAYLRVTLSLVRHIGPDTLRNLVNDALKFANDTILGSLRSENCARWNEAFARGILSEVEELQSWAREERGNLKLLSASEQIIRLALAEDPINFASQFGSAAGRKLWPTITKALVVELFSKYKETGFFGGKQKKLFEQMVKQLRP